MINSLIIAAFAVIIILLGGAAIFVTVCVHRVFSLPRLSGVRSSVGWALSALPAAVCAALCLLGGGITPIVCLLHLVAFIVLCDLVAVIFRRRFRDKDSRRRKSLIAAVLLCAAYLAAGAVNAVTVTRTDYILTSDKPLGQENLRIVQISDSHMGATFDADGFSGYIDEISACEPDLLVVTGDFVDESTTVEDMRGACAALGRTRTRYGVYFVFGNHDQNSYRSTREFTTDELVAELEKNGVITLFDEAILVNDSFYVCGRLDASDPNRLSPADLTAPLDKSKYIIMLDHQPVEYEAENKAGVDLVFSGHTHGGQMIPLALLSPLLSANEQVYGCELAGDTACIVTSGISAWGVPIRTGVATEYVVADVKGSK